MMKSVRVIMTLVVIVLCVFIVGVQLSMSQAPSEISPLNALWFAWPYMWLLLVGLCIIALITRSVTALIVGISALLTTFETARTVIDMGPLGANGLNTDVGSDTLTFLTYNVHGLHYNGKQTLAEVMDFVLDERADVVCLQELAMNRKMKAEFEANEEIKARYPHMVRTGNQYLTMSRFPISEVAASEVTKSGEPNDIQVVDISVRPDKKIRIFNCHLASISLSDNQIDSVYTTKKDGVSKQRIRSWRGTWGKMARAFGIRETEVRLLRESIDMSPYPSLLCGDFNDTPISFTYHTLTKATPEAEPTESGMTDCHHSSGFSLCRTYRGNLPPLRIDYIMRSASLGCSDYHEHDLPMSDHRAVSAEILY